MPKFTSAARRPDFSGNSVVLLTIMPVFATAYLFLILPLIPTVENERTENILFWPVLAGLTLTLVFINSEKIDYKFFRSLPIASLIAYFAFAAASVTWAYSPEFAFKRLVGQVLVFIVVIVPYALPIRAKNIIPALHLCYAIGLVISAVYVMSTPSTLIGHTGHFTHKQELGQFCAVSIILSSYELLQRGWRRLVALIAICLGFWLVFESESKAALSLALIAITCSWLVLLICKKTRLTPAYVVGAVLIASMFISNPIERLGWYMYGDSTLTGRTGIWGFINYQIAQKLWFGWGFHSYWSVPNSPHNLAPAGYIRDMPSSHSGYLELKLETGRIGYFIFIVFIYSSLHLLERVRRKDPVRAWFFLAIELFAILNNMLDSSWVTLTQLWFVYLMIVAESVRYSLPSGALLPGPVEVVQAGHVRPSRLARSPPQ